MNSSGWKILDAGFIKRQSSGRQSNGKYRLKALIGKEKLLTSAVVANSRMNRGRGCLGRNSCRQDLLFNPVEFLKARLLQNTSAAWLDICCGEGNALIEAAKILTGSETAGCSADNVQITGVDLAGMFHEFPSRLKCLTLLEMPVENFEPSKPFDRVTSIEGLLYIGEKLSVIQKATRWIKADVIFLANIDLNNLKLVDNENNVRTFSDFLQNQGFIINRRKLLLTLHGNRFFELPFEYVGADNKAGPNYTGQQAVDSYYNF